ncbi:ATP-binding protein [Streptomyces nodosus]|uniref:ATP-binding protein n=1 Tax=Streptomyces nodosus TaxID=40318 RepID=UPI0034555752
MSPHTTSSPHLLDRAVSHRAHRLELPAHRSSARVARRSVNAWLTAWRLPAEVISDAVLLVSELVTNAVIHTLSAHILCGVQRIADAGIRLEVHDQDVRGRDLPRSLPGAEDECGRGLVLVREIADSWGVDRSAVTGGNAVWATLTCPALPAPGRGVRNGIPSRR